jgi:dTDP-4-dehydrorhamnose reductase
LKDERSFVVKVLIAGSKGQLGIELTKQLRKNDIEYVGYDLPELDISNLEQVNQVIESEKPTIVINCAAYTNVDGCETDTEGAYSVNAKGPENLAINCEKCGAKLVHISTDYVFDGKGLIENGEARPYQETDETNPQTVYGETKRAGEILVQKNCTKYFIFRTAWLYGEGKNFVRTMLALAQKHSKLTVVNDQVGSPTSTVDLTKVILELMVTENFGLYHATCHGKCSWYDFSKEIFKLRGINVEVEPVTSEAFVRPAKRPAYSVLENRKLQEIGLDSFRDWKESLKEYLGE